MTCGPTEVITLLRRDPDAFLIAQDDVALAGTLIVGWDGWQCHLYPLWESQGLEFEPQNGRWTVRL